MDEYRLVPITIRSGHWPFRFDKTHIVLQKKKRVYSYAGGWVDSSMQWVDCDAHDLHSAALALFCKPVQDAPPKNP